MAEEPEGDASGLTFMPLRYVRHVKDALGWLKPHEVREKAEKPVRVALHAESDLAFFRMQSFFEPPGWSPARRAEVSTALERAEPGQSSEADLHIWSAEMTHPRGALTFDWQQPGHLVDRAIRRHEDLAVPLARTLEPFRRPVARHIIGKISRENALFAMATALPDIVPLLSLPWAAGEFASDTAVLTANQIRMAFLLGAANDRDIGYREQRNEIGSIVAGAFGWRALARELSGHIPLGGGLIPKAAIAYAGTRVVGLSLDRYYRIGYGYTREERKAAYERALGRGKQVAGSLMNVLRRRQALPEA